MLVCLQLPTRRTSLDMDELAAPLRGMLDRLRDEDPSYLPGSAAVYLDFAAAVPLTKNSVIWEGHQMEPPQRSGRISRLHVRAATPNNEVGEEIPPLFVLPTRH